MDTTNPTRTAQPDAIDRRSWADRTRQSLRRFDRYTLEVMNPGHPYRLRTDRSA